MKIISVVLLAIFWVGCGGYGSSNSMPPQPAATPAITQLAPNSVTAGGAGFTLTINGSSFAANAVVNWSGTKPGTKFVSANQLTAAIPSSAIATPGTVSVTVTNPGTPGGQYGGGTLSETSNSMTFTIK